MTALKDIHVTGIEAHSFITIVEVLVNVGDKVATNQPLVTIESEKAMIDFPSPYNGKIQKIHITAGVEVTEGSPLVTLEIASAGDTSQPTQAEKTAASLDHNQAIEAATTRHPSPAVTGQPVPPLSQSSDAAYASPGVYKYARELSADLSAVSGSGRQQRITIEDVQNYVRKNLRAVDATATESLDFSAYGETEAIEQTRIQKLTAKNILAAWQSIPRVTHFDTADITLLEHHRKQLAKKTKLTPLAFVIKAMVATLRQFPQFNASLDAVSERLIYKKYFHIGIAVDTPHGLLVPVLRDVDKKNLRQIAMELVEISSLARQRKLTPQQMGGASITISSLGNIGGRAFTPIINPPEVAILGVSKMVIQESSTATGAARKKLLPLSLSYDHRVINGADAARFCTHVKAILEDIWRLIL